MLTAKDLVSPHVVFVDPDDTVAEVADAMRRSGRDGLPVVNLPGQLLGFVTERDLWSLTSDPDVAGHPVYHYMTRQVHAVDADAPLEDVAEVFRVLPLRRLPVLMENTLLGVVDRHDVFRHLVAAGERRNLHVAAHPVPTPRTQTKGAATTRHARRRGTSARRR